jgi:3'-phosphoadenosine 5'-phosphosulfate sulfotransferase (PAPS reductase)/FAD synthetase
MGTSKKFYRSLWVMQRRKFEVWLGVRSQESHQREKRYAGIVGDDLMKPNELFPNDFPKYLGKMGVRFRLPILDWSTEDVLEFLDGQENPLYRNGFTRVGCFPCLAGGDADMIRAFEFDDFGRQQREEVKRLSKLIGRSCFHSNIGKRWEQNESISEEEMQADCQNNPGCALCAI